jgi:predicted extracellular nuclease
MNLDRFSVATFNLYNLQLPGDHMNPGQKPWTEEEFERKAAWISGQLRSLDADVVGFEECWSREALEQVIAHDGLDAEYELLADAATGSRIVCAAMVRNGLREGRDPEWIRDFPVALRLESNDLSDVQAEHIAVQIDTFSRPILNFQVRLRDDPEPLAEVFVTHFKSKLPTRIDQETWFQQDPDLYKPHVTAIGSAISTIRRTAEATALRVLLNALMKETDTPVIVLGDCNDGQHSNTLNILTGQPRYLVGDSAGGADTGLYTAQTLQEYRDTRDVYYTHVFQDLRESLDHVLVSEQFYDNSRKRRWLFDGLVINNDHLNTEDHKANGSTDHGVVQVHFKWKPVR